MDVGRPFVVSGNIEHASISILGVKRPKPMEESRNAFLRTKSSLGVMLGVHMSVSAVISI
jgi:hypothetical protein